MLPIHTSRLRPRPSVCSTALRLAAAVLCLPLPAACPAPGDELVFQSDTVAGQVAEMREFVRRRYGLDPKGLENRHLAAALTDKLAWQSLYQPRNESVKGKTIVECVNVERMQRDWNFYKPIKAAIDAAALPDEAKQLLRLRYAMMILWPQRQGAPNTHVALEERLIGELPRETRVVTPKGKRPLITAITAAYPGFAKLSAVQQHLVLSYLDTVNHNLRLEFSLRGKPAEVTAALTETLGTDLSDIGLDRRLYRLDPTLKPEGYDAGSDPADRLIMPLGDGTVRGWCYRIRPDRRILLPPGDFLERKARPARLVLRNLWLKTLDQVAHMRPETLVLDGCDISDLAAVSAMKNLKHISLAGLPVTSLAPLKGLALESIDLRDTRVTDLTPLAGMPLRKVILIRCPVADLSPLKGAPVEHLRLWESGVTDLRPLEGMPLNHLQLKLEPAYHPAGLAVVRNMKTLTAVSDFKKKEWFAAYALRQNRRLFPSPKIGIPNDKTDSPWGIIGGPAEITAEPCD